MSLRTIITEGGLDILASIKNLDLTGPSLTAVVTRMTESQQELAYADLAESHPDSPQIADLVDLALNVLREDRLYNPRLDAQTEIAIKKLHEGRFGVSIHPDMATRRALRAGGIEFNGFDEEGVLSLPTISVVADLRARFIKGKLNRTALYRKLKNGIPLAARI